MKLAIISSKSKLSGKLTKFWTGSYAYHCGFVDIASDTFYDMHWLPRKSSWLEHGYKDVQLFEVDLTVSECEVGLKRDSKFIYGWRDYTLFAIRKLYHMFGQSTVNANGIICSELCNNWLWLNKAHSTPFNPLGEPPSPADLERFFNTIKI